VSDGNTFSRPGEATEPSAATGGLNGATAVGSPGGPPVDPRAVLAAFHSVVLDAADDQDLARRLTAAQTVVQIHFTDAPPLTLTLMLDRDPIEAVEGEVGQAEVHVFARTEDVHRVFTGEAQLPVLILRGEASYNGPVRKFLRVLPIVRRMSDSYRAHHGDADS
jgi:hypothetical protein